MTKETSLRSLDAFADKSITSGLKYIWGGATQDTEGDRHTGTFPEQNFDYVADVRNTSTGGTLYGMCSGYANAAAFFAGDAYKEFVRSN